MKDMSKEINYKEFEDKLLLLYPNLSEKEAKKIIKQLFKFWGEMIENIDKFEK